MRITVVLLGFLLGCTCMYAQEKNYTDSNAILQFNQSIDNAVVGQDLSSLKQWYADDFIFSHGSGKVEGKSGWLNSVSKGNFIRRQHDSVLVEMHQGLAIATGKLSVQKKSGEIINRYYLYYIRVFAFRNKKWQLVSHRTLSEVHEPGM